MATTAAPAQKSQRGVTLDPALQAIFTDMATFMSANGYASMNCTTSVTSAGTTQTAQCGSPGSTDTWTYTQFSAGPKVTVAPMSASLGPAATQQFVATATDGDGNAIATPTFKWSITAGGQGTIDSNGLYTAPATVTANATDTCKCQLDGSQSFTQFTVSLHP